MPTENLEGTRAGLQLMISWGSGGRGELRIDWINPDTRRNTNRTLFGVTESVYAQLRPLLLAAFDAPPTQHGTHQAENAGCLINSNLWLNEYDPDLEAIARYADPSHDECEGVGAVRECSEWVFCSCTQAALLAAVEEPTTVEINGISVQLGVQKPPNDYRIFKGTMADFFDSAVASAGALRAQMRKLRLPQ